MGIFYSSKRKECQQESRGGAKQDGDKRHWLVGDDGRVSSSEASIEELQCPEVRGDMRRLDTGDSVILPQRIPRVQLVDRPLTPSPIDAQRIEKSDNQNAEVQRGYPSF